jgi:hypothetical protein
VKLFGWLCDRIFCSSLVMAVLMVTMGCASRQAFESGRVYGNDGRFDGTVITAGDHGGFGFVIDKDHIRYAVFSFPEPPIEWASCAICEGDEITLMIRRPNGEYEVEAFRLTKSRKSYEWIGSDEGEGVMILSKDPNEMHRPFPDPLR